MKTKAIAITRLNIATGNAASTWLIAIAVYILLSSVAYALSSVAYACFPGNQLTPMGDVLCKVVWFMYGNLGRGLATLGVVVIGIGALLGKTSWGMALTVGVGISIIFNAERITSLLLCGSANQPIC